MDALWIVLTLIVILAAVSVGVIAMLRKQRSGGVIAAKRTRSKR